MSFTVRDMFEALNSIVSLAISTNRAQPLEQPSDELRAIYRNAAGHATLASEIRELRLQPRPERIVRTAPTPRARNQPVGTLQVRASRRRTEHYPDIRLPPAGDRKLSQ